MAAALGEVVRCLGCGQLSGTGKQWEGPCNGDAMHGPTETVTAYDARDVAPLLDAAQETCDRIEYLRGGLTETQEAVLEELQEIATKALAPFGSEESQ
jgi:hypothetical protein